MTARAQLELERGVALASELHPDHWPAWLVDLADRLDAGQAWFERDHGGRRHQQTTALALAVVGRDPAERIGHRGPELKPRVRIRFAAEVQRVAPLRDAIIEARAVEPDIIARTFGRCAADCQGVDPITLEPVAALDTPDEL